MGKLRLVRMYNADDVPEHIFQEVCDLVTKIGDALGPALGNAHPNIVLSAFARFHAAMIVALVAEDSLEDAAKAEAVGILKNVDDIAKTKYFGEND